MQGNALKLQAFGFAISIGLVAFLLSSFSEFDNTTHGLSLRNPIIIALACGVLAWGAADRLISLVTSSIDAAVSRLSAAAQGDLVSPLPEDLDSTLPDLSQSLGELFEHVRSNIEHVNSIALFDPVTALANRLHFRNETEASLARAPADRVDALLFIDLDNFKNVNDTLGHAAGDQLLIMIANRLRSIFPAAGVRGSQPVLGRLAGDEFTSFIPDVNSSEKVCALANLVLRALSEPFGIAGQSVRVGASIGIAMRPAHGSARHPISAHR